MATRRKSTAIEVPETVKDAQKLLAMIGQHDRAAALIASDYEAKATALKSLSAAAMKKHVDAADALFLQLKAFAEAHPEIMPKRRKSLKWPAGDIGFRFTPYAASIGKGMADAVLAAAEKIGSKYVRVTRSLDKQALLTDRKTLPAITGLSFTRTHEFFAKPIDGGVEHKRKVTIKTKVRGAKK